MAKKVKVPKRIAGMKIKKKHRRKLTSALAVVEAAQTLAILATAIGAYLGNKGTKRSNRKLRAA